MPLFWGNVSILTGECEGTDTAGQSWPRGEGSGGSGEDAGTLNGQDGAYYLSRTNHTGTQAISTVSELQGTLDGKAPLVHNHDGRYYTQEQVDAIIDGITGGASFPENQYQKLVFDNVPAPMEFGIEIGAGTMPAVINAAMSAEALQAVLESCDDLTGYSVSVVGATNAEGVGDDGAALYSGKMFVFLEGASPYPAWSIKNSEVQNFTVEDGDANDYSLNSGDEFSLGISEGDLQTNQRALGGSYSDVVAKGQSTPGSSVLVEGAGSADWDGTYVYVDDYAGNPHYQKGSEDKHLYVYASSWWLAPWEGSPLMYRHTDASGLPPASGWEVIEGDAPAPGMTVYDEYEGLYRLYFPFAAGNVSSSSTTGTGATTSTVYEGGSEATILTATEPTLGELLLTGLLWPESPPLLNYTPANAGHWAVVPSTIPQALDMIASKLNSLDGPV